MSKLRLGVIGLGNMGSEHCRLVLSDRAKDVTLCCVADLREERRAWAAKILPETVKVYASGQELIEAADCDAVIIAVPHYDHPVLAEMALRRGLHVLCEKPVAVYTQQVQPVLDAAKETGKTFALMFNQRTNCVYRKMKEILESGELGSMKRMSWIITDWYRSQAYYDSGSWRATWEGEGGGVLLNQCPHQLDLLQWICGLPVKVSAFAHEGKWHDVEVEDDVTAYLEFPNGATGVFITTTGDAPGTNRLEIDGTLGKVVCENDVLTFQKLAVNEREWCATCQEGFRKPDCETITVETDGENPQHVGVMNAFAAAIEKGGKLVADGREGINGLMLSNAIHLSAWTGETVSLPIDEKKFYDMLMEKCKTSRHKEEVDIEVENQ